MSYLAFPTPRPPAQARRASAAAKSSPPPPYVHDFAGGNPGHGETEESNLSTNHWENQPRDELAGIFTRADGMIRERERGELCAQKAPCAC